jgi:hypothetical protein
LYFELGKHCWLVIKKVSDWKLRVLIFSRSLLQFSNDILGLWKTLFYNIFVFTLLSNRDFGWWTMTEHCNLMDHKRFH